MKIQAMFTLLFFFSSVFNLHQAAPVDEQRDAVEELMNSPLFAEFQAVLQAEKAGGKKGNLVDVVTQTDEDVESNDSVDVATQTHKEDDSKDSQDNGKQMDEEEDSNYSIDGKGWMKIDEDGITRWMKIGSKDEDVDSIDSLHIGTQTDDGKPFLMPTTQRSTSQVCMLANGKMECVVDVCKSVNESDKPLERLMCELGLQHYMQEKPLVIPPGFRLVRH